MKYLAPAVRAKVLAMLATDTDLLTAHDFLTETTWADRYRDSSAAYRQATASWHFVDIEIADHDIDSACSNYTALAVGTAATAGPAQEPEEFVEVSTTQVYGKLPKPKSDSYASQSHS